MDFETYQYCDLSVTVPMPLDVAQQTLDHLKYLQFTTKLDAAGKYALDFSIGALEATLKQSPTIKKKVPQ